MKKYSMRSTALAAAFAATTLILAACGGSSDAPAAPAAPAPAPTPAPEPAGPEDLVINGVFIADGATYAAALDEGAISAYLAYGERAMTNMLTLFTEQTGIKVDFLQQPTGRMVERVLTEIGANALEADVVMVPEDANLLTFVEAGVYQPHRVPNEDEFDASYVRDDSLFIKPVTGSSILAYNSGVLSADQAPTTYTDLLKPEFRGNIGLVPITQGATGYTLWRMLLEDYGIEFWEQMAEQEINLQPGTGPLHDALTRGEYAVAAGRPPILATQIADGAPLELVFPSDARTPGFVWGIGITSTTVRPNAAAVLVNWFTSVVGQEAFALNSGDFPTHPDAPRPVVRGQELPAVNFYFHDDTPAEVERYKALWERIFNQ